MPVNSTVAKLAANILVPSVYREQQNAVQVQHRLLMQLVSAAANTEFGKQHGFKSIKNYSDFKKAVQSR